MQAESMHGAKAVELVRQLKRNPGLPQYQEAELRKVTQEIQALTDVIFRTLQDNNYEVKDLGVACSLVVHHHSVLRNKRCVLAYLFQRLARLKSLWWQRGGVLNATTQSSLGQSEAVFMQAYEKLLDKYVTDTEIPMLHDLAPPKELLVEVKCLRDAGSIITDKGCVNLVKNSVHLLRRSDVELLIRQGALELRNRPS